MGSLAGNLSTLGGDVGAKWADRKFTATVTDWGRMRRRSAASIRKGMTPDPDARFWKTAKVVMPTPKEIVTMPLDADLLRWLRQQRGYQTRINAILRAYMKAHESA